MRISTTMDLNKIWADISSLSEEYKWFEPEFYGYKSANKAAADEIFADGQCPQGGRHEGV
jgi:hypothetical protein